MKGIQVCSNEGPHQSWHKASLDEGIQVYSNEKTINFHKVNFGFFLLLLSMSYLWLGVEKKVFKETHLFYTFYPRIIFGWGHEISCLLTQQMLLASFG